MNATLTNEYHFKFGFTPNLGGSLNMDLDRRLVEANPEVPSVRFYTWAAQTISCGCHQDPSARIRLDLCLRHGLDVVRRPTGGRELLHGDDLCYSVIWPLRTDRRATEARIIFKRINGILTAALQRLGVRAEYSRVSRGGVSPGPCFAQIDRGEIMSGGRKLLASAQRIHERAVLQQGSMLLRKPSVDLASFLKTDDPGGVRQKLREMTTWLGEHVDETFPMESIVRKFGEEFERFFETKASLLDNLPDESMMSSLELRGK